MGSGSCCNIRGGDEFLAGPNGRLSRSGALPKCRKCGSMERHRILRSIWARIPLDFLSRSRALQFSPDLSVDPDWFSSYELSIYGGDNSIDLEAIDRASATYDVIICNHVLEHIPDDRKAFTELIRVLSPSGFLEVTVPNPYFRKITEDRGPKIHEHFRTYGADISLRFNGTKSTVLLHRVTGKDMVTGRKDYVFFWTKSERTLKDLQEWFR